MSSSHCGQLCFLLNITESWSNNNKSSYAVGNDLKTEFKYKSKNIFINDTPDLTVFSTSRINLQRFFHCLTVPSCTCR